MDYQAVMQHFGTPAALARALSEVGCAISQQAIYKWRDAGIPIDRAHLIEEASSGHIRCGIDICTHVDWTRDAAGKLTGYQVRIPQSKTEAA